MGQYTTMASMMGGASAQGTVPTQTFNASNIIGTPVPLVGDNKARPHYAGAMGGTSDTHVVLAAVALFAVGYLLFHLNFEK